MATINEIEKLRPDLLEISDAEFERRKTELEMAELRRKEIREERQKAEWLSEAQNLYDDVVPKLKRLHDIGYLPQLLSEPLTMKSKLGEAVFNPGVKWKRPRG